MTTHYPGAYAATHPDRPAQIMAATGEVTTFGQLHEAATRLARLFRSAGLEPGDHIAFCMENNPTLSRGGVGRALRRALLHRHQLAAAAPMRPRTSSTTVAPGPT